jgi:hypothetical protein
MTTIKTNDKRTQRPVELGSLKIKQTFTLKGCKQVYGKLSIEMGDGIFINCINMSDCALITIGKNTLVVPCDIEIIIGGGCE